MHVEEIETALERCGLFAAISTSGQVHPAASFAETAQAHGAHTAELNLKPTMVTRAFGEGRYGRATEGVPAWVDEVLAEAWHDGRS